MDELERRLRGAERWIAQRKLQQVSYPLDEASKKILYKDVLLVRRMPVLEGADHGPNDGYMSCAINGAEVWVRMTD